MVLTDYFVGNLGIRAEEFVKPVSNDVKTLIEI